MTVAIGGVMPVSNRLKRPRKQGRPSVAVGKTAIVLAAREALKVTPPGEITFQIVARIAKIDQRLIRYYYGYLPDLLKAVAIEVTEELRERFKLESLNDGISPRECLRSRVRIFLEFFGSNPHYHRLVVDYLINSKGPDSDAAVTRIRQSAEELRAVLQICSPHKILSTEEARLLHVSISALCEYLFSARAIFVMVLGSDVNDRKFQSRFVDFVTGLIFDSLKCSD